MDLKCKRFLVIGGAGFIGSHLVDSLLKEGVELVRVFDNFSRGTRENLLESSNDPRLEIYPLGGEIIHRDLLMDAMKDVDGVFHLAALWLLHCQDFEDSAFKVNIEGAYNVAKAVIASGVKRVVYSSSASVYGDAVTEPMNEDHPYNNTNFYGATKIAAEHIYRSLFHRYKNTDKKFDYVGLRYMNVYGPRQDYRGAYIAVIMKILDRLDEGLPPVIYGDGSQAYDFVNVKDCALANVCAMKAMTSDEFYNVGTGIKTTIKELVDLILKVTDSPLEPVYKSAGQTFVKNRVGCPEKAKQQINFAARIALEQGICELIEWRNAHKEEVLSRQKVAGISV